MANTKPTADEIMKRCSVLFKKSGMTLEALGLAMGADPDTARMTAWQFLNKTTDPRLSMLQRFAKAICVPLDHLTPRGKRMSRKLETELQECRCDLSPVDFRDLLIERKHDTSPAWTIDELVCHPDEAKEYCNVIRAETKCPEMSDDLILRTLMNVRRSN